jgi:hypothetical protein
MIIAGRAVGRIATGLAVVALAATGCGGASSTDGSAVPAGVAPSVPSSGAPSSVSSAGSSSTGLDPGEAAVARQYVTAIFVERDAKKSGQYVDPADRSQATSSAQSEIEQISSDDRYEVGAPAPEGADAVVIPLTNTGDNGSLTAIDSYKVHLTLQRAGGSWQVNGYRKTSWNPSAVAPSRPHNPSFSCTPAFVTTLSGFPVARLVSGYPVPRLKPQPEGLSGQDGVRRLRSGELTVLYTAQSTGLPQGPSKSMYDCFTKYVTRHGWRPDASMDKLSHKSAKDPVLSFFYDSGSRYRGGNELVAKYFTTQQTIGRTGPQLVIAMDPHGFLPDLPPPPK